MKYCKKPVIIDAVRWDGLEETMVDIMQLPRRDKALAIRVEQDCLFIPTLEGLMRAERGDWIICGIKGELYPCKPDIFEMTYEPCDAPKR